MRILLLSRSLEAGGAERQVLSLAQGLAARGHDCAIAIFYGDSTQHAGLRIIPLRKRGRWDVPGFLARLAGVLRRERPDVVYAFLPVANILAVLLRRLCPGAGIVLGIRSSNMDPQRYDRLSRLSYRLEARVARFADAIIVNAEAGKRAALARGIPAEPIAVVRNGVDIRTFRRDPGAGRRFRDELGVRDDDIVVGMVARFDPMKDHETFLQAVRAAGPLVASLRAVIVGDGPEPVRDRAAALGSMVHFTGWRDDMPAVYSGLDILCLSSAFGEGTPNVIAEAMACEVPCVVTDVGDCAAMVDALGRVAPPHDHAALADALVQLATLPPGQRRELGRCARERIQTLCSEDSLAAETERVLSVVRARRPAIRRLRSP